MSSMVSLENVTKAYLIGQHMAGRRSLIGQFLRRQGSIESFNSLSDVTAEIYKGESVAVIGDNGSGKSTLLKIISNITSPSSGNAVVHGRVGSLLDIGAGLWDELSGYENIFVNGAILGMSKPEIKSQVASIIEFSEIKQFINTPVRRYSSGMRMRLSISIAIHQISDLLIIDEVLAVGDEQFRKKCQDKLLELVDLGKTLIVVSHFPEMLLSLCSRGLVLKEGALIFDGEISAALAFHKSL